ncbi:MAG: hypothetical protein ACLTOZ_14890, partial [[Clostridium] leptum]
FLGCLISIGHSSYPKIFTQLSLNLPPPRFVPVGFNPSRFKNAAGQGCAFWPSVEGKGSFPKKFSSFCSGEA